MLRQLHGGDVWISTRITVEKPPFLGKAPRPAVIRLGGCPPAPHYIWGVRLRWVCIFGPAFSGHLWGRRLSTLSTFCPRSGGGENSAAGPLPVGLAAGGSPPVPANPRLTRLSTCPQPLRLLLIYIFKVIQSLFLGRRRSVGLVTDGDRLKYKRHHARLAGRVEPVDA